MASSVSFLKTQVFLLLVALVALPFARFGRAQNAAINLFIEAEDCDGLLRFPYDNEEASGWYAREACCRGYGAPGRTYCAAIHENAPPARRSMKQELPAALPPGKYRLFLRIVGPTPRSRAAETVVRVLLGRSQADFKWSKGTKRFKWLPGVDVELKETALEVGFTAVKFGGNGHGVIHEPLHRSIRVNTLYITNDLTRNAPPSITEEYSLRTGVDYSALGERPRYQSDDFGPSNQLTPKPADLVFDDPILLAAFDGRKNHWPNSSFELGMNDGWACSARAVKHVFTDEDLDEKDAFHGRYSLRVPANANPFSRPYYLSQGGQMTLSFHARGQEGKISAQLLRVEGDYKHKVMGDRVPIARKPVISLSINLSRDWQRFSGTAQLADGWYYLSFRNSVEMWLDAVQLERGESASSYSPRAKLEGALRTGRLGNIIYEDQESLTAWFHNSGARPVRARLQYRVVDVRERVVAKGTTRPVPVPSGATVKHDFKIVPRVRGIFSVMYAIRGRNMPEGETVYLRMPRPARAKTRHELGANMSLDKFKLLLHKRLGLKWALTCKTRILGSAGEHVHRKPNEWQWFDEEAARPAKLGMGVIPCFWPSRIPAFMTAKPAGECQATARWVQETCA